jgi:hypothetical protein
MASRITWQNIAAPDFSAALQAVASSGDLFQSGTESISDGLSGIGQRRKANLSAAAMNKAMQYRDVDGWDAALAGGGLAALGINADQATPELMQFMQGYREDLATDRADDLSHVRNGVALEADRLGLTLDQQQIAQNAQDYDQDRRAFEQGYTQTDYTNARGKTLDGRADDAFALQEEARLRNEEAARIAQGLGSSLDVEEAKRKVLEADYSPEMEEAVLRSLGALDPTTWATDSRIAGTGASNGAYEVLRRKIEAENAESSFTDGADRILQLYSEGRQLSSAYGDPVAGVAAAMRSHITVGGGEDAESAFSRETGEIYNVHRQIKAAFPRMSDEVIASVMRANLRGTGVDGPGISWIGDGQLQFNKGQIWEELGKIDTPAERKKLEDQRQKVDAGIRDRTARSQKLEQEALQVDRLLTLGRQEEADEIMKGWETAATAGTRDSFPDIGGMRDAAGYDPAAGLSPRQAYDAAIPKSGNPLDQVFDVGQAMQRAVGPRQQPQTPVERAKTTPNETLQTLATQAGLDPGQVMLMEQFQRILDQDRKSGGKVLSPEKRATLEKQIETLAGLAQEKLPEGSEEAGLLENIKSWFPFKR